MDGLTNVSCETIMDENIKLGIYKQFFAQWERLHAFNGARELQMECAQQLVETADMIRNLDKENGKKA